MGKPPEQTKITVRASVDLVRRAKHRAVDLDVTLQDLVVLALERYLKETKA
jgi:hypothetical protein